MARSQTLSRCKAKGKGWPSSCKNAASRVLVAESEPSDKRVSPPNFVGPLSRCLTQNDPLVADSKRIHRRDTVRGNTGECLRDPELQSGEPEPDRSPKRHVRRSLRSDVTVRAVTAEGMRNPSFANTTLVSDVAVHAVTAERTHPEVRLQTQSTDQAQLTRRTSIGAKKTPKRPSIRGSDGSGTVAIMSWEIWLDVNATL